jgi:Flp pilus assembly protein TadD
LQKAAFFAEFSNAGEMEDPLMINGVRRLIVAVVVLMFGGTVGFAQVSGGLNETTNSNMGGNHYIVGTVFWPSGKPVNTRLRLKLVSMARGEVLAMTDDSGRFVFSRVAVGSYSIVIDRDENFEAVTQFVDVEPNRTSQTYSVSIRLSDKSKPSTKPGVVDTKTASVPKRALEFYEKANKLSAEKDHRGAIEQLRLAVAEHQNYADAYNEMGVQYMRINELEKAAEVLDAALKIKPDAFEPLLNKGIALFRLARYGDAEGLLRSAIGVKKDSALAHYYLGRCLTSLERFDDAEKELNTSIKIGGGEMNEAHRMLANLFITKGDDSRAVEELELYLKLVPQAPDAVKLREVIRQLKAPKQTRPN